MSKQSINDALLFIDGAIKGGAYEQAQEAAEALANRRLNKEQRQQYEMLKEALAEEADNEEKEYTMSNHLSKYRERYQISIAASGAKSLNNGDDLAQYLEMKTAKEVCDLADIFTPNKDGQPHIERYARLNEGQKRMNSGNKLRAKAKKGEIEVTENGIQFI